MVALIYQSPVHSLLFLDAFSSCFPVILSSTTLVLILGDFYLSVGIPSNTAPHLTSHFLGLRSSSDIALHPTSAAHSQSHNLVFIYSLTFTSCLANPLNLQSIDLCPVPHLPVLHPS